MFPACLIAIKLVEAVVVAMFMQMIFEMVMSGDDGGVGAGCDEEGILLSILVTFYCGDYDAVYVCMCVVLHC